MQLHTKIHLSKTEIELVKNSEWILTKQVIVSKVVTFLSHIQEDCKAFMQQQDFTLIPGNGKVFKGENYKGLPYVISDYPAIFGNDHIFAIRMMFWWGNFFSITLHLKGKFMQRAAGHEAIYNYLSNGDYYICVNENQWQHDFESNNYVKVSDIAFQQFENLMKKEFFKVSKKILIDQWEASASFYQSEFKFLIKLFISFQGDGKDLLPGLPKGGSDL